jgi:CRISPR/Cas system-associated endonuclease Cas1
MLSATDYLEKQVAFIDILQHREISLQNENLIVKENGKIVNKMSISKLFCIFIIGECSFSTRLIEALYDWNVSIYFLSYTLKPKFLV